MIMYPIDQKDNIYCSISQCNVVNIFSNQCYENGETYLQIIEQQILFRCNFLKQTKDQEKNIQVMQPLSSQTNDLQRISLYMYQRLLCFATPLLLNF